MEEKIWQNLQLENEELRKRLCEAEEVLEAIRKGGVDAIVVADAQSDIIFTLSGADRVYRTLIDTMNEGAVTLSSDGVILYGNNCFELMLKCPMTRMLGASIFEFVSVQDREHLQALLNKGRGGSSKAEIGLVTGDGTILPTRFSISEVELDDSTGFCVVLSDLSEEKRVQAELSTHRDHLERLVADRTAELRKTQGELESRVEERTVRLQSYSAKLEAINRELTDFIHVASHDLQEPLRKIQTFCSRIRSDLGKYSPEAKTLDYLDRMQGAARRMQDLIRALTGYSHVFGNPGPFQLLDLKSLVLDVEKELSGFIKETGAEVRIWNLPSVEGDAAQLRRLFKDLLENALKFRGDEPLKVSIYGEERRGSVRLFIEDNGVGLDEGSLKYIFKPFQQLHRRGVFEGTGMGLAVCRKIVESHGGAITVESAPNAGSKFIVTLPLNQPDWSVGMEPSASLQRTKEDLLLEVYRLRERISESEDVLSAIREGKVDALVSYDGEDEKVYTLKSADRGYRTLVESIDEGAVILSFEGFIYYSNPRFDQMLKKEDHGAASQSLHEFVFEEDRIKFDALLEEARKGRIVRGEIRLKVGDDFQLPVHASLSPLRMEEFRGICVAFTDLTEQKSYIERLERSNRELQEFASIASHDLQEPLRKVQVFGELIESKFGDVLSDEGRDYLNRMRSASKRMQTFIEELLAYSRVTTRAEPFRKVDLRSIIQSVVSDLQVRIDETGGRVHIGEIPILEASPGQMRQLFLNLIGNALKFHGEEKPVVKVYGHLAEGEPLDKAFAGPYCRIYVEDNGIGFEESQTERIFAPFQRLHGRSRYEGTGMGLAICKKIVDRHGGAITARSAPGEGATFIVTIPLKPREGGKS